MEDQIPGREEETMQNNGRLETTPVECTSELDTVTETASPATGRPEEVADRRSAIEGSRMSDNGPHMLDSEVLIQFKNIKTAMVLSPNHRWPIEVEGLLVQHRRLPLSARVEVTMMVGDREVVSEQFHLPTDRREEVMEADRKLAEVNSSILVNEDLRTRALEIFYPELSADYDLWYRIAIDEHGLMSYALHTGPSDHQEIKNRIEGTLQF